VMTRGGPLDKTLSAVMLMYQQGFRWWRMGYAAAIAMMLFIVIAIATAIQMKLQEKR
jgi:multiple sugar transport system permease protein